jgi:hypothetical protein
LGTTATASPYWINSLEKKSARGHAAADESLKLVEMRLNLYTERYN